VRKDLLCPLAQECLRFVFIVALVVVGYTTLKLFYLRYLMQAPSRGQAVGVDLLSPRPNVS
jgi:hypothetical protein